MSTNKSRGRSRTGLAVSIAFVILVAANAQERFASGPYVGFLKEKPELNKIELADPIFVSVVKGTVVYSGTRPLSGAVFEIRAVDGQVLSATTDRQGQFLIPSVSPGTYAFKVTKDEFHSVVGTLVVSGKAGQKTSIRIQLHLGT